MSFVIITFIQIALFIMSFGFEVKQTNQFMYRRLIESTFIQCSFISVYRKPADPRVTRDQATSHDPNRRGYSVAGTTLFKCLSTSVPEQS